MFIDLSINVVRSVISEIAEPGTPHERQRGAQRRAPSGGLGRLVGRHPQALLQRVLTYRILIDYRFPCISSVFV